MIEKYLVIYPSGHLAWAELDRAPRYDDVYEGRLALDLKDLYRIIGCDCVEQVRTIIPGIVIVVDESGKIKQIPQPLNPIASKLYAARLTVIRSLVRLSCLRCDLPSRMGKLIGLPSLLQMKRNYRYAWEFCSLVNKNFKEGFGELWNIRGKLLVGRELSPIRVQKVAAFISSLLCLRVLMVQVLPVAVSGSIRKR